MIPKFPNFKPLELSDYDEVRSFTSRFEPYSDFNFVSMWSWNLAEEFALSQLHGNLVVRLTDYLTGKPFYSFLGDQSVDQTCEALLTFSKQSGLEPVLRMVPEVSVRSVDTNKYIVVESRDHFDYVYCLQDLLGYHGPRYASKRNEVNQFLRQFPGVEVRTFSPCDHATTADVFDLFARWQRHKLETGKDASTKDLYATKKLLDEIAVFDLVTVGLYIDATLIAVLINEMLDSEYAMGHFMKADISAASGVYTYLMQKNAEVLLSHNLKFLNYEQDLGLENLRTAKTLFRPHCFLKKYTVRYHEQ